MSFLNANEPLIIVQARISSTRLPGKVMLELGGKKVIDRVMRSCLAVAKTVVAIPDNEPAFAEYLKGQGYEVFEGHPTDVLKRYYDCAGKYEGKTIVRVTADCPLIPAEMVHQVLLKHSENNPDRYTSNTLTRTYPKGFDCEVFSIELLTRAHQEASDAYDREHVTPYIKRAAEDRINVSQPIDQSMFNACIDTPEDYEYLKKIIEKN